MSTINPRHGAGERYRFVSRFLIWLLGTRRYLRIPQRWRRRLGLVCGEDMSDTIALLKRLQGSR